jgi:hypothetical protein
MPRRSKEIRTWEYPLLVKFTQNNECELFSSSHKKKIGSLLDIRYKGKKIATIKVLKKISIGHTYFPSLYRYQIDDVELQKLQDWFADVKAGLEQAYNKRLEHIDFIKTLPDAFTLQSLFKSNITRLRLKNGMEILLLENDVREWLVLGKEYKAVLLGYSASDFSILYKEKAFSNMEYSEEQNRTTLYF